MTHSEIIKSERILKEKLSSAASPIQDYYRHISGKSVKTKFAYYTNLELFFRFLSLFFDEFKDISISTIDYKTLNKIDLEHIGKYKEYLSQYEYEGKTKDGEIHLTNRENGLEGINAKLTTIKSLYTNLYKISLSKSTDDTEKLSHNLSGLIKLEKTHVKIKTRLSTEQLREFLDVISNGSGDHGSFTKRQKTEISNNYLDRNLCIIALLGETGIRISELCGMNMDDVNFHDKKIIITRKGGKQEFVYFNFSEFYLKTYFQTRAVLEPKDPKALFISKQMSRITPRGVQKMIDKYSELFTNQNISPHTFRRSFATNLYEQTGDVYLVASLIGDTVAITTKHYASQSDARKRDAIDGYLGVKK